MAGNAESERSTDMENEVWSEISAFLNNLRCGDVSRKSYPPESEGLHTSFPYSIVPALVFFSPFPQALSGTGRSRKDQKGKKSKF